LLVPDVLVTIVENSPNSSVFRQQFEVMAINRIAPPLVIQLPPILDSLNGTMTAALNDRNRNAAFGGNLTGARSI
jgi:hypothetical protein